MTATAPNDIAASAEFPSEETESEMERLCRRGKVGLCRVRHHKGKYWEIDASHPGGVKLPRARRYFSTATAAVRGARNMTREIREHGVLSRALTTSERWVAAECFKRLKPISADPAELLHVVGDYLKRHPLSGLARSLDDVRKEVVAKKKKIGRSDRHVANLDYKLRRLVAAIGPKAVTAITPRDLEAELEEHPDWKPTTVHSTVQAWKILFNFAVRAGYITENPADKIELPKIIHDEPRVLTVEEAKRLMAATLFSDRNPLLPDCRAYLAIGMFAGIRPDEMSRLDWRNVDLATATITIRAADAKCRDRRIVEMSANLIAWLRPISRPRGKVLPRPLADLRAAARSVLGLDEWPADVLRHTFASYHYGHHRNEALTKHQMGHRDDGRLLHNHYCIPVHPTQARLFWAIVPPVALLQAA